MCNSPEAGSLCGFAKSKDSQRAKVCVCLSGMRMHLRMRVESGPRAPKKVRREDKQQLN